MFYSREKQKYIAKIQVIVKYQGWDSATYFITAK